MDENAQMPHGRKYTISECDVIYVSTTHCVFFVFVIYFEDLVIRLAHTVDVDYVYEYLQRRD